MNLHKSLKIIVDPKKMDHLEKGAKICDKALTIAFAILVFLIVLVILLTK